MSFDVAKHNRMLEQAVAAVRAATLDVIEHPLSSHDREAIRQATELLVHLINGQRLAERDPFEQRLAALDAADAELERKLKARFHGDMP